MFIGQLNVEQAFEYLDAFDGFMIYILITLLQNCHGCAYDRIWYDCMHI